MILATAGSDIFGFPIHAHPVDGRFMGVRKFRYKLLRWVVDDETSRAAIIIIIIRHIHTTRIYDIRLRVMHDA